MRNLKEFKDAISDAAIKTETNGITFVTLMGDTWVDKNSMAAPLRVWWNEDSTYGDLRGFLEKSGFVYQEGTTKTP